MRSNREYKICPKPGTRLTLEIHIWRMASNHSKQVNDLNRRLFEPGFFNEEVIRNLWINIIFIV